MRNILLTDISSWATIGGVAVSVASLVATSLVARNTNRLNKAMHVERLQREADRGAEENRSLLRFRGATIRQEISSFRAEELDWRNRPAEAHPGQFDAPAAGKHLVREVELSGSDVVPLITLLKIVKGHSFWLYDAAKHREWLAKSSDSNETDGEWAAGVLNGALDVMSDFVLEQSDYARIEDEFWVTLDSPDFNVVTSSNSLSAAVPDSLKESARKRWVPSKITSDTNARITALVDYKATFEHLLAFTMRATFTNGLHLQRRDEKFMQAMPSIMSKLVQMVDDQATLTMTEIDKQISSAPIS